MKPILRFDGVSLRRGEREVLHALDLELHPGEVLGLVGRNGAGKTTLLRLASRVLLPDHGRIELDGLPIGDYARRALAQRIAVVPQEATFPFAFSAFELVLMGRSPHLGALGFESPRDVAIARDALERAGVADLAERPVTSLSGGERQLVLVARALAQTAEVLLFDEATAFLDLQHRARVLALARGLAAEGRAALVVSHDLTLAARYCDRMALLDHGAIRASGSPREVLEPARIERAFGLPVDVVEGPDGAPVVVPGVLRFGPSSLD